MFPGQKNAGRVYREFTFTDITAIALPQNIAAAGNVEIRIPWAVDGYSRCQISGLLGTRAGVGTFALHVKPWGSNGAAWPGDQFWPVTPNIADYGVAGFPTAFNFSIFDGPTPGNWNVTDQNGTFAVGGNSLNPSMFLNAAMLQFQLVNVSGAMLPLNELRFILSGGK